MVSKRAERTIERWNSLAHAGGGTVALGVAGKSATSLGVVVSLVGLAISPVVTAVGALVALLGIAGWWWSAHAISTRGELSRGRAAWMLWCIPTWSVLGALSDVLDTF